MGEGGIRAHTRKGGGRGKRKDTGAVGVDLEQHGADPDPGAASSDRERLPAGAVEVDLCSGTASAQTRRAASSDHVWTLMCDGPDPVAAVRGQISPATLLLRPLPLPTRGLRGLKGWGQTGQRRIQERRSVEEEHGQGGFEQEFGSDSGAELLVHKSNQCVCVCGRGLLLVLSSATGSTRATQ